jgi:hypothetical protein
MIRRTADFSSILLSQTAQPKSTQMHTEAHSNKPLGLRGDNRMPCRYIKLNISSDPPGNTTVEVCLTGAPTLHVVVHIGFRKN